MNTDRVLRLLLGLAAILIVLLGFAVVSLIVQSGRDRDAARSAAVAARRATLSLERTASAQSRITMALSQAESALKQSRGAFNGVQAVQQSRLFACRDTNARHKATVDDLGRMFSQAARRSHLSRKEERSLAASRVAILGIINAIVPYHNCGAYLKLTAPSKPGL